MSMQSFETFFSGIKALQHGGVCDMLFLEVI